MTPNEHQAIIDYIEFNLVQFVEGFAQQVAHEVSQQMYEQAYSVLNDIDDALCLQAELDGPPIPSISS